MRFNIEDAWKKNVDYAAKTTQRMFTQGITASGRKVARLFGFRALSQQLLKDIKKIGKDKGGFQPSSLRDYVDFGRFYVSKILLALLALALLGVVVVGVKVVYPLVMSKFFTRELPITSSLIAGYNGKVRLISTEGMTVFEGTLADGHITGTGVLYDLCGNLVYSGGFQEELYSGSGELYYSDGTLCYEGDFADNLYQGTGSLYYRSGQLHYQGDFANGLFEGKGTLYTQSGEIAYIGEFSAGQYNGTGELYHNGKLAYRGEFLDGKREGEGVEYDASGDVLYSGTFTADVFITGRGGQETYPSGVVKYTGDRVDGLYDGKGTLYNEDGTVLYQGEFSEGVYQGDGVLTWTNDAGQAIRLEGTFDKGKLNGEGRQYAEGCHFPRSTERRHLFQIRLQDGAEF